MQVAMGRVFGMGQTSSGNSMQLSVPQSSGEGGVVVNQGGGGVPLMPNETREEQNEKLADTMRAMMGDFSGLSGSKQPMVRIYSMFDCRKLFRDI